MAEEKLDLVSREQALRVARMLGCQGAHETEKGWMPCESHEEYEAIKKGKEEYLKVLASKKKKPLPKMVQRTKRLETKSDAYYENRADAVAISKARGCGGVRTVLLAGRKYYAVCNHKAPKRGWENLDEKPITGIATLPGGGLVSGSFTGKSLGRPIGGVSDSDGDGDGFTTGPDGEDDVPFTGRKLNESINAVDTVLSHIKNLEKKYSKKFGDLRDPINAQKAIRAYFPNMVDDQDLTTMYPARNEDGSVKIRGIDVARVVMLLHASDGDKAIAQKISVVGVNGKLAGGLFGGGYPGLFIWGVGNNAEKPFFAGLDFSPQFERLPYGRKETWGGKVASEMKDKGYSQEDIDIFSGAYLASHEFGHAKHLLRSLEKAGVDINAKSETELISNLKKMHMVYDIDQRFQPKNLTDKDIENQIDGVIFTGRWKDEQDDATRRRLALLKVIQEAESGFIRKLTNNNNPLLWDSLTDSEITQIATREEWVKISDYARENATEFVAEVVSQRLMDYRGEHTPTNWGKMSDWLNIKSEHKHEVRTVRVSGINEKLDGVISILCSGLNELSLSVKPQEKGFVNFVSRSTDPDTFSDPESARIRSRNLGCIGIRRYTARDGKLVWMPCTNVSDYNRVTGIRGDNSPRNNPRRQGSAFRKKVLGTPIGAKPSDELVDGDGDGLSTGGIVGGKDNIPVAPKTVKDAVNKIVKAETEAGLHAQRILNTAVFDPKDYEPEIYRNTFRPQQLEDGTYFDYAFGADPAKWVPLLEQFKKENPLYLTGFEKNGLPFATETLIRYKDLEPKIHPDKPHRLGGRQRIKAKNIVDTSPKNDSEVMDRGLYLWERNGITKNPMGDDPNFCSILGWCAASILGIAKGWEKPDQTFRGNKEVPHSDLLWLARNLLTGIAKSKPQPALWRGIAGTHQDKLVQNAVGSLKAGDTFDIGLGSTSRDVNIALKYNGWFAKEELVLRIQEGSKGVKIPRGLSQFPEDQEVLTSGRFEVKSIEKVQIGNNELNLKREEKRLNDIKILLKDEENLSALLEYQQRQIDKIKSPQKPFFITIIDVVQKEILYGA